MNAREKLLAVAEWLGWQDENLSAGLRCAEDGIKLHAYWQERADTLPEMADESHDDDGNEVAPHRVAAIGYDPMTEPLHKA